MPEPIEGAYFNWLRGKVVDYDTPPYMYVEFLKIFYRTEFIWIQVGDRNRIDDGLELRDAFLAETGYDDDQYWHESPCSALELLIAFSHRAAFETDEEPKVWFWRFITNLGLDRYTQATGSDAEIIESTLDILIWRRYDYSGYGGLFPLREPFEDQTKLELWFQLNRYLDEQGL